MEDFEVDGIRVIHCKTESDVSCINVFFKVGSYSENENIVGISHFLEHLIMKDKKVSLLSEYGCDYNAITERNLTYYYFSTYVDYFEKIVKTFSKLFLYKFTTGEKFKKEIDVVTQEIKNCKEMQECHYVDLLENMIYKGNTLSLSTVGEEDKLKNLSFKQVKKYFDTYYVKKNMVIAIVSSKDSDEIKDIISKSSFTKIKMGKEHFSNGKTTIQKKQLIHIDERHRDKAYLHVGILFERKYLHIINLIKIILAGDLHSRLYKDLRYKGYIYNIQSSIECYEEIGNFNISTSCDHKNYQKCINIIIKNYESLGKIEIPKKELENAKKAIKGTLFLKYNSPLERSIFMGKQYIFRDTYDYNNFLDMIESITSKDILKFCNKHLNKNKINIVTNK